MGKLLTEHSDKLKKKYQARNKLRAIANKNSHSPITRKKFGKNVIRRLGAKTKGVIATAIETISRRRGSSVILVNSAGTKQMDSRYGILLGKRKGDSYSRQKFLRNFCLEYCFDRVALQADDNAARNVLARLHDLEIDRWTPWQKVKSILLKFPCATTVGTAQPGL